MRYGKGLGRRALFVAVAVGALVAAAPAAGADVVSPAGACTGTGTWAGSGQRESSADHETSDVIEVPQSDTVSWTGVIGTNSVDSTGPERETSGSVTLALPIGSVTLGDWSDDDSVSYGEAGERSYDLPSVVIGVEMQLSGEHSEGGAEVCSGSVGVVVEGSPWSNPLTYGALLLAALSGVGLWAAAAAKGGS
jgi:hypothetical protein